MKASEQGHEGETAAVRLLALWNGTDSMPAMRGVWSCLFTALLLTGRMPAAEAVVVYENYCAACHGLDGRGQTPQGRKVKARNLRDSRLTEAEIERQIRAGARNKSGVMVMPAFGKELKDGEIQAVITVVMAFRPPPE